MKYCECGNEITEKHKRKCIKCRDPRVRVCIRDGCDNELEKGQRICSSCKEKELLAKLRYCRACGIILYSNAARYCDECNSKDKVENVIDSLEGKIRRYGWPLPEHRLEAWCSTNRNPLGEAARKTDYEVMWKFNHLKGEGVLDHCISVTRLGYLFAINYKNGRIRENTDDFKKFKRDCLILIKVYKKQNDKELKEMQNLSNKYDTAKDYAITYYNTIGGIANIKDGKPISKDEFLKRFERVEKWWHK